MLLHLYIYSSNEDEDHEECEGFSQDDFISYSIVEEFSIRSDECEENIRTGWTLNITHPENKERMLLDIFELEKTDDGWNCAVISINESREVYPLQ
ncbi:hypothetical protein CL644_00760 [bacterium]|nr:hypothetical protein [bacterium]|tara:strand:- start:1004 stop:1291 length:288 start_codon:yes stop_codon:yes gene_type:complete